MLQFKNVVKPLNYHQNYRTNISKITKCYSCHYYYRRFHCQYTCCTTQCMSYDYDHKGKCHTYHCNHCNYCTHCCYHDRHDEEP